jgi:hypothetical protein
MDLKNWQYSCTPFTPKVLFTLPTCSTRSTGTQIVMAALLHSRHTQGFVHVNVHAVNMQHTQHRHTDTNWQSCCTHFALKVLFTLPTCSTQPQAHSPQHFRRTGAFDGETAEHVS